MLTDSPDVLPIPPCTLSHLSLPIEKWSDVGSKSKLEEHKIVLREITGPRQGSCLSKHI